MFFLLFKKTIGAKIPRLVMAALIAVFIVTSHLILAGYYLNKYFVYAAYNKQINYQGKLTNASNVAVADGSYIMKFRLYTTATSATTTNIWEEIRTATGDKITVTNGLFSAMLGSSTALTSVDFNQTLYLGVEVCGTVALSGCDDEMTPRKILGLVPGAFEADKIDGFSSEQFLRSDAINSTSTASTWLTFTQNGAGNIAEFVGPSSAPVLTVTRSRVGVGTSSPFATLSVSTTTASDPSHPLFSVASSTHATLFNVLGSGNVGVGTSSPNWKFSVTGIGSFDDFVRASYFTATSTTVASTFPYASTTALTVSGSGGLQLATGMHGPLHVNNGLVGATSSIGVLYGGTGLTTAPSYGEVLVGNNSSGYTLTATSSLGIAFSSILGTLGVSQGGTGAAAFGQGWVYSTGGTTALAASTSPTINYLTATSTTATSTFAFDLSVGRNLAFSSTTATSSIYVAKNTTTGGLGRSLLIIGGDAGTSCFAAGTKITLADKSHKNIEEIKVGESVLSYDTKENKFVPGVVTDVFHHLALAMTGAYYLSIRTKKHKIKVTVEHPFYDFKKGVWTKADDLTVGVVLLNDDGEEDEIISIEKINEKIPTFNLTVENEHNYFAGVLVHNKAENDGGNVYIFGGQKSAGGTRDGDVILGHSSISAVGNVGIGTTTPFAALSVLGKNVSTGNAPIGFAVYGGTNTGVDGGAGGGLILQGGVGGSTGLGAGGAGGSINITGGNAGSGDSDNGGGHVYISGGQGALVHGNILLGINSAGITSGNIGVGDASPAALLTVGASDAFQVNSSGRALANVGASGAGNLAYSFVGDTDTGFYRSATDEIRFQTGGADRLTISSGKIGIGTTTPFSTLSVSTTTQSSGSIPLFTVASTTHATLFTVLGNGNVGISTSTPYAGLSIQTAGASSHALVIKGSASQTANLIEFRDSNGVLRGRLLDESSFGGTAGMVDLELGSTIYLQSSNNTIYTGTLSASSFTTGANNTTLALNARAFSTAIPTVKVDPTGITNSTGEYVGLEIETPYNQTSTAAGTDLLIDRTETAVGSGNQYLIDARVGSVTKFNVTNAGRLGLSTTTPWKTLSVNGTVGFAALTGSTGAGSLCLSSAKEVVYNSGSDNCLTSLRDTKHNIDSLNVDALSIINSLVPVSFIYNEGNGRTRYGFIAEDTALVDEHLATYDNLGGLSGIDDRALLSVSIKAIQQLNLNLEYLVGEPSDGGAFAGGPEAMAIAESFAERFYDAITAKIAVWFANVANNIGSIFANTFNAREKICVDDQCLTKNDVRRLLELANNPNGNPPNQPTPQPPPPEPPPPEPPPPEPIPEPDPDIRPDETPPPAPPEPPTPPEPPPEP